MKLKVNSYVEITKPIILDQNRWRHSTPIEEITRKSALVIPGDFKLNSIIWEDGTEDEPVFSFNEEPNYTLHDYPEFSISEIKRFIDDGTFIVK